LRKLREIADLLALGMGIPLLISSLEGRFAVPETGANSQWAEIIIGGINESEQEIPHYSKMIFTFKEVQDRFAAMASTWLSIVKEVEPTYHLYSATIRSSSMYAEHRLFNLFQSLESLHRRTVSPNESEKKLILERRDKIIAQANENDHAWLKEKLAFCHEPSAAQRIQDLTRRFGAEWIFGKEWESVIQRIAKARNYLTHYGKKPPEGDLEPITLLNFSSMLQVLCEAIFLCKMGFSNKEAETLLQSKRRLQNITYQEA